jgi:threonine dehydrogenase-like Zn-dependent dehydrogenase
MLAAFLDADWKPRKGYTPSEHEIKTRYVKYGSRVWHNPKLELKQVPTPEVGPKDVLLRVKACGICGSDVHLYEKDLEGYMLYPGLVKLPDIIGHEFSGEITKVGSDVRGLRVGDMVTAEEMNWCGECVPCRNGYPNQCKNLEEIGLTIWGGMAEYLLVNSKYCWKIDSLKDVYKSDDEVYEAGSLVEPTAVAYNAMFVRGEGFKPGANVVVWGAGPIGLAATSLAKAAGASKIVVFETVPERAEIAEAVGATRVLNPAELSEKGVTPHEKVLELTGDVGSEFQVEAAGSPSKTLPEMEKCMSIGGKIVWIGRADVEAPIFMEWFQVGASQVYGSQGHSGYGTFMNVIRLLASGRIDMTKIITRRFKLADVQDAMVQATKRTDVKITIKP